MISIVVAYDKNRGIGALGDLPWKRDLPADLKRVKELTVGKSIVMGRKTFQSIGRALPDRENIVITRNKIDNRDIVAVKSLAEAYQKAKFEIVIFGGSSVYEQAMPDVDVVYATEVKHEFAGIDTFFAPLGSDWQETERIENKRDERNLYDYDFVTYQRN